jgi:HEAT repeat protein
MDNHRRRRLARSSTRTKINLDALLADLTSGDDSRAEAAMHKLVALGKEAQPALRELAAAPDSDQRWWAVSTLAQMDDVDVDILLTALEDDSVEVQQSAALGLTQHPHPKAASALLSLLPNPDSVLRNLAMNALIALGKDATPGLLRFLDEHTKPDAARLSAIRALANLGDYDAIPALMNALESESALIQHWAEEGLQKLGLDMVYMKLG